jgi:endonuclease III
LQKLLHRVRADHGTTSLRWLGRESTSDALAYLTSLPGVGLKTARCVLMYALERPVLAVDTHVWRVAKRLGWIDGGKHPDNRRSEKLERRIPPGLRYSLHVTMVAHGRRVCRGRPACHLCVLSDLCPKIGLDGEQAQLRSAPSNKLLYECRGGSENRWPLLRVKPGCRERLRVGRLHAGDPLASSSR